MEYKYFKLDSVPKNIKQMPDISITITGTENLLKNLNPNKASGPGEISPNLLKELHHEIAPTLTKIFKSSLHSGIEENLVFETVQSGPYSSFEYFFCS